MTNRQPRIGTLRERPLHAALKRWYAADGDGVEVDVDGYVVDVVSGDTLIEVQTRSFAKMKQKLAALLDLGHRVRIAYPVALEKWIVKLDAGGAAVSRRRSPKRGKPSDVFAELVSFPDLILHPNLELDLVMISEEEVRRHAPGKAWRRNGWIVVERHLVEVAHTVRIADADDLAALLPEGLPDPFTTADLAAALGRPRRAAQQMTYCLRIAGAISIAGKTGNTIEYRR